MNAVRSELSWTHYRLLIQIDNEKARKYYLSETIKQTCNKDLCNNLKLLLMVSHYSVPHPSAIVPLAGMGFL